MNRLARRIAWFLTNTLVQGGLLALLAALLPGFQLRSVEAALVGGLAITTVLTGGWGFILATAARLHPLLFPVVSFWLTGLAVTLIIRALDLLELGPVRITSIWVGAFIALGLTFGNTLIGALFSLADEAGYERFVTRPLRQKYGRAVLDSSSGVLFLEIDGLAEPVLRRAVEGGYMPVIARWLERGSHRLHRWEPDLSSQTSASQAGILLGDNDGIPAFRWYDKPSRQLMISSKRTTARALEDRLSTGQGLLAEGGASRWNVFSGDAPDCLGTYSRVGDREGGGQLSYYAYFVNPYTLARTTGLFIADVVRERWEAWRQSRQDVRPRIRRSLRYALVRAATTTVLQEASLFMLQADMFRGVPVVYNTFFAYDEVAHHSGVDRPDALKVLKRLDRAIGVLERASELASRRYHMVVLSDHGQSQGATFRQRYGHTLGELVDRLTSPEYTVAVLANLEEDVDNVSVAVGEAVRRSARTARLAQRTLRTRLREDEVLLDRKRQVTQGQAQRMVDASNVVVLASGNLGLISFTDFPERLTYEVLIMEFPGLLEGLAGHEGISFVLVRSETAGGLVIGVEGIHYLDTGEVEGEDPLRRFGPRAAVHLRRTDGFPNAPDILVMSMYDPTTGEVAAFEELVGSHGGLGGPQTEPLILYPSVWRLEGEVIGAERLHQVLKGWVQNLRQAHRMIDPHP